MYRHLQLKSGVAAAVLALSLGVAQAQDAPADLDAAGQARFSQQINSLLAQKESMTPAQKKLASQLAFALPGKQAQLAPNGLRARSVVAANASADVTITGKVTPEVLIAIVRAGGKVLGNRPDSDTIQARLSPDQAEKVAALDEVRSILLTEKPIAWTGDLDSEGDTTHRATKARTLSTTQGSGIKVGVISDGVTALATSQSAGELGTVTVIKNGAGVVQTGSGSEGVAMLEIVHDLAPKADLFFATGFGGQASMAENIGLLQAAGCKIIVDDVAYFGESIYQEDAISKAIRQVSNKGVLYFTAAGNFGNKSSGKSGVWEGTFVNGGPATDLGNATAKLHDWGGGTRNVVLTSAGSNSGVFLQWSDLFTNALDDYDLIIVDADGNVVDFSATTQDGTTPPFESIGGVFPGEKLVVWKFKGAAKTLHLSMYPGTLTKITRGSVRGHNGAEFAVSVAATPAATAPAGRPNGPFPGPFVASNLTEYFSSDGPRQIFFKPDGTPQARVLQKPDLTAADGVTTSVSGFRPFFGTSAAAPHAAAIAALVWSVKPTLTAAQVKNKLIKSAVDIMGAGVDRDSGAGIIMANIAVSSVLPAAATTGSATGN